MYTFTFNAPDTLQADEAQQQLKRAEDALQLKRREEVRGVQCLCVCVCVCVLVPVQWKRDGERSRKY